MDSAATQCLIIAACRNAGGLYSPEHPSRADLSTRPTIFFDNELPSSERTKGTSVLGRFTVIRFRPPFGGTGPRFLVRFFMLQIHLVQNVRAGIQRGFHLVSQSIQKQRQLA